MKSGTTLLLLFVALAPVSGCLRRDSVPQTRIWVRGGGAVPTLAKAEQYRHIDRTVMVGDEIVSFAPQRWGDAEIEGGSLVTVERKGQVEYLRADFTEDPERAVAVSRELLAQMRGERQTVLTRWRDRAPRGMKVVSEIEVVLVPARGKLVPVYRFDALENDSRITRFWISRTGVLFSKRKESSDLFDAEAWIYTIANGKSVQEVLLKRMLEGNDVRGLTHEVQSQAPLKPTSEAAPWRFAPEDPRFDQVQAYYFVQLGLDFFAKELGFTMPVKLEIETAVGYPDKTGAAFSYSNQIRLGSGDGVTFRSMAQDPSVVIHEVGHSLNHLIARLPTQGEGGSLNEAFADYFAASCLGESKLGLRASVGAPFLRDLANDAGYDGRNAGLYHDSLIVSGTLWELRAKLGAALANKLAIKTLTRLGPARALADFPPALRLAGKDLLSAAQVTALEEILRRRKWVD